MKMMSTAAAMAIVAGWLAPTLAWADVRIEGTFGNHMVLQREKPIPIKGTAKPGEEVTIEFAGQKKAAKAEEKEAEERENGRSA